MGWFDEQIRARKQSDQEILEASMLEMASAVLGEQDAGSLKDRRIVSKNAVDQILKYYHFQPVDIPDGIETAQAQLEYALKQHGMASRSVKLSGPWYRQSFGPMLAFRKEDGFPVALMPKRLRGYEWTNAAGHSVSAGKRTADQLEPEAICVYPALPLKQLGISDLLGFMKNCLRAGDFAVLLLLTLLVTVAGLLLPRITKLLSGFVLESGSTMILWSTAAFLLCVLIASQLFSASRALAMRRIQTKVTLPMEAAMMMRLISLPAPFFRRFSSGDLASRITQVSDLCTIVYSGVFSLGTTAVASLLYLFQIYRYTPALLGPVLAVVLLTAAVMTWTGHLRQKQMRDYMRERAGEAGVSFALISGIQKIRLAGAEKRAFARWARRYAKAAQTEFQPPLILKIEPAITLAVPLLGAAAIYYLAVRSGVAPSAYLAFSAAYGAITGAFGALAGSVASAAQIKPILEMAEPILKTEPETAERKEIVTHLSGSIALSGVSFRYDENRPYVIRDLDLRIRAGEYLAIVGKTGCGKSTLLRLLLGFETPETGAIYYDKKDLRTLDLGSLRQNMGVVTQDGSLFLGDIYSNITVSAPQLTLDDAWAAAETAGIADDIRAMPMGMHTIIGEGQGGISGGQRQRLLIARAIASRPKILLFDEATSALDNKTQKQVSDALDALHCTRIVIAHRLSTVKNCDRIVVLDGGKITEDGTYDELMEEGGFFAGLVERQRLDTAESSPM